MKPQKPLEDVFMDRTVAAAQRAGVEQDLQATLAALQRLAAAGRIKVARAALDFVELSATDQPLFTLEPAVVPEGLQAYPGVVAGDEPIHWSAVEERLQRLEAVYAEIGTPGVFVREHVLRPLRDRFNAGERSRELAAEIEEVEF